jgi:hypothetical protein
MLLEKKKTCETNPKVKQAKATSTKARWLARAKRRKPRSLQSPGSMFGLVLTGR